MKDLQDVLDATPLDQLYALADMMEPNRLEKNAHKIWEIIRSVWYNETSNRLDVNQLSDAEVHNHIERFAIQVNLYIAVRTGSMSINGRFTLSDANSAVISLTSGKKSGNNKSK